MASVVAAMAAPSLGESEFRRFQKLIFEAAGIHMSDAKRNMVAGRLAKRLKVLNLGDYASYLNRLDDDRNERQLAVDLLTTNETYFFREPKHFDFLRERLLLEHDRRDAFRVWSAACSSGEEPYSVAMALADSLGGSDWRILASDISTRVLNRAQAGKYPLSRADRVPREYLKRFCLRGVGDHEGSFLIDRKLRDRIAFRQINLNGPLPGMERFHLILLRNVMIYFSIETKREVVRRVAERLLPGGYFFIGHSESLNGIAGELQQVAPSIYRKSG